MPIYDCCHVVFAFRGASGKIIKIRQRFVIHPLSGAQERKYDKVTTMRNFYVYL
jgi:hypothetical protein